VVPVTALRASSAPTGEFLMSLRLKNALRGKPRTSSFHHRSSASSAGMTFSIGILSMVAAAAMALPTKPVDGIRDDGRVLDGDEAGPGARARCFAQQTSIQLFIDTNTYLDSSMSAGERARALLRAWSREPDPCSLIVCVDCSSRGLPVLHVSADLWQRYSEPQLITVLSAVAGHMGVTKSPTTPSPRACAC